MFGTMMFGTTMWAASGAEHVVAGLCRLTAVAAEDRFEDVTAEDRTLGVAVENRIVEVGC